jgi:hypothetical protein
MLLCFGFLLLRHSREIPRQPQVIGGRETEMT